MMYRLRLPVLDRPGSTAWLKAMILASGVWDPRMFSFLMTVYTLVSSVVRFWMSSSFTGMMPALDFPASDSTSIPEICITYFTPGICSMVFSRFSPTLMVRFVEADSGRE